MSTQADMLINEAERAFQEARQFRDAADMKRKQEEINIQSALETAQAESDDPDKAEYWKTHADQLKERLEHDVNDLLSKAEQKTKEGEQHKSEARAAAQQEHDEKRRGMLDKALRLLDNMDR